MPAEVAGLVLGTVWNEDEERVVDDLIAEGQDSGRPVEGGGLVTATCLYMRFPGRATLPRSAPRRTPILMNQNHPKKHMMYPSPFPGPSPLSKGFAT